MWSAVSSNTNMYTSVTARTKDLLGLLLCFNSTTMVHMMNGMLTLVVHTKVVECCDLLLVDVFSWLYGIQSLPLAANGWFSCICYRLRAMSNRILVFSSTPPNLFCASIMWIMFFLLPGVSLAITPSAYDYFYFPYNVLAVVVIIGNGFFRAVMRHRIPGVIFVWPNPSAMGALVAGVTLTVTCAATYFPCILCLEWANPSSACTYCFVIVLYLFTGIAEYDYVRIWTHGICPWKCIGIVLTQQLCEWTLSVNVLCLWHHKPK